MRITFRLNRSLALKFQPADAVQGWQLQVGPVVVKGI